MLKNILVVAVLVSVGVYKFIDHQSSSSMTADPFSTPDVSLIKASNIGSADRKAFAEPIRHLAQAMPSVQDSESNIENLRIGLRREIQSLREDLHLQQRSLAAKTQDFERSRVSGGDRNPASSTATADIASRNEELRNLSNNLNEMRVSGENIRHQEDYAIRLRENATKLAVSKLDFSLQRMEQWTANTQIQLERWLRDHVLGNGSPAQNKELENTLVQQRLHIETLREQRLNVTDDHHRRANNIYSLGQQAREDLRGKEMSVRGQIFSLQNEIRGMETTQTEEKANRLYDTSQSQQAHREIQAEAEKVRRIETSLLAKQAELKSLD